MTRRAALWAGLAVILAVSGGTLLGVLWNRTGTPDAVLVLEERELILLPAERENSGRAMTFMIDGERAEWLSASPPWLDGAKLAALGFDTSVDAEADDAERHYRAQPRRQVFVALELGGDAFRKYFTAFEERLRKEAAGTGGKPPTPERLAEIERELATAPESASRLTLIDADRDREALRARHPDRSKVAILRAVARIGWDRPEVTGTGEPPKSALIEGRIGELQPATLTVPPRLHAALEALPLEESGPQLLGADPIALLGRPSRYRVHVAFGRSLEPWIESIEPLEK
ncbi:MAG: DUF4824 family protein [Acidobacteria bacterium]|jgi:hypothetical protein|nr:DUF4824 family protein [Acidobacteriota bacterium]MCU0254958.1 DUF4824 family protein [Acidobacteriota bacterium]